MNSTTTAVWLLIAVALLAANLPFANQRLLGVVPLRAPKRLPLRLLEWLVMYGATGALGLALEHRLGQIAPQDGAFYAITLALFATFAFPGFVWQYLVRRRR